MKTLKQYIKLILEAKSFDPQQTNLVLWDHFLQKYDSSPEYEYAMQKGSKIPHDALIEMARNKEENPTILRVVYEFAYNNMDVAFSLIENPSTPKEVISKLADQNMIFRRKVEEIRGNPVDDSIMTIEDYNTIKTYLTNMGLAINNYVMTGVEDDGEEVDNFLNKILDPSILLKISRNPDYWKAGNLLEIKSIESYLEDNYGFFSHLYKIHKEGPGSRGIKRKYKFDKPPSFEKFFEIVRNMVELLRYESRVVFIKKNLLEFTKNIVGNIIPIKDIETTIVLNKFIYSKKIGKIKYFVEINAFEKEMMDVSFFYFKKGVKHKFGYLDVSAEAPNLEFVRLKNEIEIMANEFAQLLQTSSS